MTDAYVMPDLNAPGRYRPPTPRQDGDRLVWADVIVGEIPGFRPVALDLFRPRPADRDCPLVIWIHGGAFLEGTNKREARSLQSANIGERILAAGFALARVTYRLTGEALFPAQVHDLKAAVRWLRHHAAELGLDPARFGVWGESAGGHLAAMLALTGGRPELRGAVGILDEADAVQAGVVWYGPSNLLSMQSQMPAVGLLDHDAPDSPESRLVGGPVQQHPEQARQASPVSYAVADAPPLLLVHGADDRVVPAGQSVELHERLLEAGAPVNLRIVPGADHGFVGADLGPLVDDALAFLRAGLVAR
ncbi:alpha/beta hydrolase fold domain-containing protein [Streptomyces sp. NPDC002491]